MHKIPIVKGDEENVFRNKIFYVSVILKMTQQVQYTFIQSNPRYRTILRSHSADRSDLVRINRVGIVSSFLGL